MFGLDDEEELDLVAVDAEMLKTMLETQGRIIGKLELLLRLNSHFCNALDGIFEMHKHIHDFMKAGVTCDKAMSGSLKDITEMLDVLEKRINELSTLRSVQK